MCCTKTAKGIYQFLKNKGVLLCSSFSADLHFVCLFYIVLVQEQNRLWGLFEDWFKKVQTGLALFHGEARKNCDVYH